MPLELLHHHPAPVVVRNVVASPSRLGALDEEDVVPWLLAARPGVDAGQVEVEGLEDRERVRERAGRGVVDRE